MRVESGAAHVPGIAGRIGRALVLRSDLLEPATQALLLSSARVVIVAQHGSLSEQLDRAIAPRVPVRIFASPAVNRAKTTVPPVAIPELEFFNGLGGFGSGGKEYVTILGPANRRRRRGST